MNTGKGSNLANTYDKVYCELCILWCVVLAELDLHNAAGSTEKALRHSLRNKNQLLKCTM